MPRDFNYRSEQIQDIVRAYKRLRQPQLITPETPLPFKSRGLNGRQLDLDLDLAGGPLLNLRLHVRAGVVAHPDSYEAALILDGQRVRGVGFNPAEQKRWYRVSIPKGWHHNIIDPNLDGADRNRHEALNDFAPQELDAFFWKVVHLWNISIPREGRLL